MPNPSSSLGLTLAEYAERHGLTPWTVRGMIKRGELQATLVKGRHGMEYRINSGVTLDQAWANPSSSLGKADGSLGELVELVRDQQRQLTRLNEERAELFGRLGYFQAQLEAARTQLQVTQDELRVAQTRLVELEAPKEVVSEMSNHPTPEQNAADSASQKVSPRPWWQFWRSG